MAKKHVNKVELERARLSFGRFLPYEPNVSQKKRRRLERQRRAMGR